MEPTDKEQPREHMERAKEHAQRGVGEAGAAASEAGAAARKKGREAAERVSEATGRAAEKGQELAGRAQAAGAEMMESLKQRAGEAYEQVAQQTRGIAESARQVGDMAAHRVAEGVEKLSEVAHKADFGLIRRFLTAYQGEPWYMKAWIWSLFFVNTLMPLLYIDKLESWVVLLTNLASSITMFALYVVSGGYTRILGLAHLWWLPMLAWINSRIRYLDALLPSEARPVGVVPHTAPAIKTADLDWFNGWLKLLMGMNVLALCMDTYNVLRYATGDRGIKTKIYPSGREVAGYAREQAREMSGERRSGGSSSSSSEPSDIHPAATGSRERQSYSEVASRAGVAGRAY